jgi:GTP-binding protein HflX
LPHGSRSTGTAAERAILVGVEQRARRPAGVREEFDYTPEESLDELASLAETAGASVVRRLIQSRQRADAATLIGAGKVEELTALVASEKADIVLFDQELTPSQLRNLERALDARIVDRTQLILDIFAKRARTREGQLQVELAQLNYLLPRLAGRGVEMSRLGGGIGTRGPGETQLETDRRRIHRRIRKIEEDLEDVVSGRGIQRRKRQDVPLATLALVGYTNAGKSTLFNRLTGAGVVADARLFATLDPTVRHLELPSRRRVLLSDTVGFIRSLPTTLVKAFRATLEEVKQSALLLHVVDAASPRNTQQTQHVLRVLGEIGAGETPQLLVLTKADLLPNAVDAAENAETIARRILGDAGETIHARAAAVSSLTGAGFTHLLELIDESLSLDPVAAAVFRIPASDGGALNLLHEGARILERSLDHDWYVIKVEAPESLRKRLAGYLEAVQD